MKTFAHVLGELLGRLRASSGARFVPPAATRSPVPRLDVSSPGVGPATARIAPGPTVLAGVDPVARRARTWRADTARLYYAPSCGWGREGAYVPAVPDLSQGAASPFLAVGLAIGPAAAPPTSDPGFSVAGSPVRRAEPPSTPPSTPAAPPLPLLPSSPAAPVSSVGVPPLGVPAVRVPSVREPSPRAPRRRAPSVRADSRARPRRSPTDCRSLLERAADDEHGTRVFRVFE